MDPLLALTTPRPLYLRWDRQGAVDWNTAWLEQFGPTRSAIPGLDEHVSFANYDLRMNGLPEIQRESDGKLFVLCTLPVAPDELDAAKRLSSLVSMREKAVLQTLVASLGKVAGILDVVGHHGFEPADKTPGLRYLDSIRPRQPLKRAP